MPRSCRSGRRQQLKRAMQSQYTEPLASFNADEFLETFDYYQHIQPSLDEINDSNHLTNNIAEESNSEIILESQRRKRHFSEINEFKEIEVIYDNKPRIKSIETLIPPIKFRLLQVIDTIVID